MNETMNSTDYSVTSPQVYERLVEEKQALDEKIVKLNAFLYDRENANAVVGCTQVCLMLEQRGIMIHYSNILNERILRWGEE